MWEGSGERSLLLVIYRDLFELIRLPQQTSAGASVTVSWPEGSNKPLQYRSLIPQSISTSRGREASPRIKKRGGEQPMKDLGGEGRKMKKWRGERERLFTPRLFAGMHATVTWRLTCDLFKRQQDDCFNHTCKHPAMKCVYGKKKKIRRPPIICSKNEYKHNCPCLSFLSTQKLRNTALTDFQSLRWCVQVSCFVWPLFQTPKRLN